MNLQYISDNNGNTTGVFIPIQDWESLKKRFTALENEETQMVNVPEWHKDLVRQRLDDYKKNPSSALDFDAAMDDIEKEL